MDLNYITVAIPTHGRADLVVRLINALKNESKDIEVIIVDDSQPEDRVIIAQALASMPRTHLLVEYINVSAKRNLAAKSASGSLVLFLDSDCIPQPGLITAHVNFWKNAPIDAASGLGVLNMEGPESFWWRIIQQTDLLSPFVWAKKYIRVPWGPTANLSVKRDIFLAHGGFDERLSPPATGGEDVELGLRLQSKGYVTYCIPDATAVHSTETWLKISQILTRLWMWGRGDAELLERFPERCRSNPPSLLSTLAGLTIISTILAVFTPDVRWLLVTPVTFILIMSSISVLQRKNNNTWLGAYVRLVYLVLDASRALHAKSRLSRILLNRFDFSPDDTPVWKEIAADQWHYAIWTIFTMTVFALWIPR